MNIFIDVVGCTSNQSDASIARYLLHHESSYQLVDTSEQAEVILLFTCTVISSTEQRMISKIQRYITQGKTVIVTGCMATIQSDAIKQLDPDIICIPPDKIHHLLPLLQDSSKTTNQSMKYQCRKHYSSVMAPISISEGCNFSCSYCITTKARGPLQSYPVESIRHDIHQALLQGCKEIQLTAQDTASYGTDIGVTLAELLNNLPLNSHFFRVRVGMMNPATLLPQLTQIIHAYNDKHIYKFLHLPIQSGDDDLLCSMGRKYTVKDVLHIITTFRKSYPDITLATDVIVGFPGETEYHHQKTKNLLQTLHPDIVNITKFSARPFTKAKKMKKRIPTHIVKQRSKELTHLTSTISYNQNKLHVGRTYSLLITEQGKQQSMIGRTNQYKPVVLKEPVKIGDVVDASIIDAKSTYLVGILK